MWSNFWTGIESHSQPVLNMRVYTYSLYVIPSLMFPLLYRRYDIEKQTILTQAAKANFDIGWRRSRDSSVGIATG
jgi:hypothetical protein